MRQRGFLSFITLVILALLLQACGRGFEAQEACNFLLNNNSQRVSWKARLPVRLHIHQSVPTQYYRPIELAVEHWNQSHPEQKLFEIVGYGTTGSSRPTRDGHNVIYWLTTWDQPHSREQGRTTLHWAGSQILEADIAINAEPGRHSFYAGDEEYLMGPHQVDFKSLMIHELGHALGMAHMQSPGSVMSPYLASGVSRRELGEADVHSLLCEY